MKIVTIILFVFAVIQQAFPQKEISISNLKPRLDIDGDTIDLHDGRIIKFGDNFYWYGTSYGNTSGFVRTNHFRCYSSPDMMNWTKLGNLLKSQPSGIYYRPHVIFNQKTKKYVLWYNWYPTLWDGKFGVAISDSPAGPFKIVDTDVKVAHSDLGAGDFGLFVDDDQTAYIVYNTIEGHQNSVEKLSSDYLSSSMANGGFIAAGCEAGAIFKRDNLYYLLTDYTCCFCTQGSGARVYVSDNPLSGYQIKNNINRYPGTLAMQLIDGNKNPNHYVALKRLDDSSISPIQIDFPDANCFNRLNIFFFTGNRSEICGDTLAKRVHPEIVTPEFDLFIKQNNEWKKIDVDVLVEKTSVFNKISFDFDYINSSSILLKPASSYPYHVVFINEIELYDSGKKISIPGQGTEAYIIDTNPLQTRPIIPAQQTFVMPLKTTEGIKYIWMGDLWGSASDNIKGHDYQYWGAPLEFDSFGNIKTMDWTDNWTLRITK